MILSILHLSDIHFKSGHNVVINRLDKIFASVKNDLKGKDYIFCLTSGDIAFSGKPDEYKIATSFYENLNRAIQEYANIRPSFIFVPGNHDCSFNSNQDQLRKIILKNFSDNGLSEITEDLINVCCSHQENFFVFRNQIEEIGQKGDLLLGHNLLNISIFKIEGLIIKFNLFNTAWDSSLNEKIGNLMYPIDYLNTRIPSVENKFSISVIHHPLNWQTPEHSKEFRKFLLKTSDIIISGHEHYSEGSLISDIGRDFDCIHIESPALQDSDNDSNSAFNLISINTESEELQVNNYTYKTDGTGYTRVENDWRKIDKNKKYKDVPIKLKKSYLSLLEDPGAKFTHSNVDEILLSDIYISPFLKNITLDKDKKSKLFRFEHADSALQISGNIDDKFQKLILGSDSSGKTTLLKSFYLKYYDKGYYPVYISIDKLTEVTIDKIVKIVKQEFKNQYDEIEETFDQVDYNKLIILVDDMHKYNRSGKVPLVKNLTKLFSNVLISGNELMMFESYTNKQNKSIELFESFDTFVIQEFNPSLRYQLINKWYRLGKDYLDASEKNTFLKRLDDASNTISNIIGKNFLPSYPIFILTILQGMELGDSEAPGNKLHAYYYELLITKSLKSALKDKEDIGFYITLCKEYFYLLFSEKIRFNPVSKDSFFKFIRGHSIKYKISKINIDAVLETLVTSKILKYDSNKDVVIAYKYLYYYFVAKYLSDNLEEKEIKKTIDLMADRVYRDEYSNIIIFLTHLSRNTYVIEKLIEKSKKIYADFDPLKMESDVNFVNDLQKTLPEKVMKELDVLQAREDDLLEEDEAELEEKDLELRSFSEEYDLNEDINSIDILALLTKALRTINILGQLTKKYWGELVGESKYNLAEETLLLGLRTLKFEYTLLEDSSEGLVEHVKKIVKKKFIKDKVTDEEVKNISENVVFNLASSAGFGILKRISNAIGSEKLSDTFDDVGKTHPYNSTELVNVGIKLDHYLGFPIQEIEALKKVNANNPLGLVILQNFVVDYLYMFELPYDKKQQICSMLNIKMQDQRAIDLTSQVRKE